MDIRQLKCFDAVLSTGAMTRAADLLGLAQPTVSITIAQLEREIGFALFKRSKGWLEPTPEAYSFHRVAKEALESIARVGQVAGEIARLNDGEISILCYPGIAWNLLPTLLTQFRRDRQGVQIKLISRSSASLRHLTMVQNFDIAVVETPVLQPAAHVELFDYRCLCALPGGHPLADKKTITAKDLDDVPFALLFSEHATHHQVRMAFSDAGSVLNAALECEFFASACRFVQEGGGVTIVDPITASQVDREGLELRPFEPAIKYQIALLRPVNRVRSQLSDAFHLLLRERLSALQTNR